MNNELSILTNELKKQEIFIAAIEINNALVPALVNAILQGVKQKVLAHKENISIQDNSQNLLTDYPGISFFYKNAQELIQEKNISFSAPNIDFWVRIEYDSQSHQLFLGYCCTENNKWMHFNWDDQLAEQLLEVPPRKAGWWAYWYFIPEESTRKIPNFKKSNEAFYALFCPKKLENFIQFCANNVIKLLKI